MQLIELNNYSSIIPLDFWEGRKEQSFWKSLQFFLKQRKTNICQSYLLFLSTVSSQPNLLIWDHIIELEDDIQENRGTVTRIQISSDDMRRLLILKQWGYVEKTYFNKFKIALLCRKHSWKKKSWELFYWPSYLVPSLDIHQTLCTTVSLEIID